MKNGSGEQDGGADLWVFGYGSLMWRPGFAFTEVHPARLHGYHRALCIYSWVWRGTKEAPGLVLGLDAGGSCLGRAYRVAAAQADDVIRYLDERELVTRVYRRVIVPVIAGSRRVAAMTYIADPTTPQYAGKLTIAEQARLVARGSGQSGPNRDYVENAVRHLGELGINDGPLHQVWEKLNVS